MKKFEKANAVVLGISPDTVEKQRKFADKHKLKVPLLADPDKSVCTAYGCYGEKMMYGRKVMGIKRTTYLIDANGRIARVFENVKVDGHAEKVLEALQGQK